MKRRADRSLFDRNVKLPISYYRETFLNYARKVYKNGSSSPSTNERYIYRGYLRLGAVDMNGGAFLYQALLWDPTEPQATRPLALLINKDSYYYYYGHDFNKNVTELFNANGDIVNHYDYRPYGALLWSEESIPNPIQYSSEIHDSELGLISYNYRHYNPEDGSWLSRDPLGEEETLNLYRFIRNNPILWFDYCGLQIIEDNDDYEEKYKTPWPSFFEPDEKPTIGTPSEESIEKLTEAVEKANTIVDRCGYKCYDVILYLKSITIAGIKDLPWEGFDQAILIAHSTKGERGNAPRKLFDISSMSKDIKMESIQNTKIQGHCKINFIGCHLKEDGVVQDFAVGKILVDKVNALKAKEDCSKVERIQIVSGTMPDYIIKRRSKKIKFGQW